MAGRRLERDVDLIALLDAVQRIAVVGLSPRPGRPSHQVAAYLQDAGYRILPVHPSGGVVLGERVVARLSDIPETDRPDLVNVFRRPEALPEVVAEAVAAGCRRLWFQLGVTHAQAEAEALAAGLDLVVDRCLLVEHRRLRRGQVRP